MLQADILHKQHGYDILVFYHKKGKRAYFDFYGTPGASASLLNQDSRVGNFMKTAFEKYMRGMVVIVNKAYKDLYLKCILHKMIYSIAEKNFIGWR